MKVCKVCKIIKPLTEFFSNGWTSADKTIKKYKPSCKSCETKDDAKRFYAIIEKYYGKMECSVCGYSRCINALELHHTNPDQKERGVSTMRNYSEKKIVAELEKCVMLCANCHREIHSS